MVLEIRESRRHDFVRAIRFYASKNDVPKEVEASATGSASSLLVVEGGEVDRVS